MKLNRRETILASAAGGILVLAVVWFLFMMGDSRSTETLRHRREELIGKVAAAQKEVDQGRRERTRLADWQHRSLPSNPAVARSLYQNWLRDMANRIGIRRLNVESKEVESRRNTFARITFALHGQASLGDLTEFLFEFYSAGHLHQIRQLDVKPLEGSHDLDVTVAIDAMSLATADSKDELCKDPGHSLRMKQLADYRDPIVKRNLFTPYSPPSPPRKLETGVDPAEFAFVTALTEIDGVRQVWLQDRMAGKTWKLKAGDKFDVGSHHGAVQSIPSDEEAVLEVDGQAPAPRWGKS
jgi:hypothetical protein